MGLICSWLSTSCRENVHRAPRHVLLPAAWLVPLIRPQAPALKLRVLCQVLLAYTGRYWDLGWVPCLALCTAVGTLLLLGYCVKESTAINAGISFNTWMGVLNPLVRWSPARSSQSAQVHRAE